MSDNVLQTTQKLVQDVIAPDVRETKVRLETLGHETNSRFEAMQKQIDFRFDGIQKQIDSLSKESEAHYRGILAAISESRAQSELVGLAAVAALRERVAVLEARAA
jgi:DNA-binding transcriptional regulator GbsR (MarR family)